MINTDSKKEIDKLKTQLSEKNKEIEMLKFQIDNPPKFKIGDKIGDLIVTERKFKYPSVIDIFTDAKFIQYSFSCILNKRILSESEKEYMNKTFIKGYVYELVNVNTGVKTNKKESELVAS